MKVEVVFDNLIMDQHTLTLANVHNLEIINIGAIGPYLHVQFQGRKFEIDIFVTSVVSINEYVDEIHYDGRGGLFSS